MSENHNDDDKTQTHIPLLKDTTVGHYRIVEKIGAGGMGEVYLAEDTELDRKVALKFLPSHLCQDEDCRARFKREAQAVARLSHTNIVHIKEVKKNRLHIWESTATTRLGLLIAKALLMYFRMI